ncbi:hypothetical protein [Clostridium saccharoperbutylacetonicum]|uniref:hypothetical protein n=1 Tax=Clostridium saccharoperbutylacetonicum TaxID=36745 RepID=UPI0039E89509
MKKRIIASMLTGLMIMGVAPIGASAEWKSDSKGWWYSEGYSWATGWKEVNGKFYYFNSDGYMAHDTTIDGYQIGSDGARVEKVYQAGEKWIVNGQWEFTINSVKTTKDRNQFWNEKPEQVVIINYTYKNLGYVGLGMDLYMREFTVMDEKGVVANLYPTNTTDCKPTPVGAISDGAEIGYGLKNDSNNITIQVQQYTGNASGQNALTKATFKVKVQ